MQTKFWMKFVLIVIIKEDLMIKVLLLHKSWNIMLFKNKKCIANLILNCVLKPQWEGPIGPCRTDQI